MGLFKSFGKNPSGAALEKLKLSANYKNGIFQNLTNTEVMSKDASMLGMIWNFMNKPRNTAPSAPLPSVKTNLHTLGNEQPIIVWFGHSSYLIRLQGLNILVDPVFSGRASPFSFGAPSFAGSDAYGVQDMPDIDILLITHDHYDHLDYKTVVQLKNKCRKIYTSIGVASHLTAWGIDQHKIHEFDWWDTVTDNGIAITAAPARHFSGRSLRRGKTLWSSFIVEAGDLKIYIGSDSGYDNIFRHIGSKYGPFDLAILEAGQYNVSWPHIHMMPEETVQAAIDLGAKMLLPVHWGKFSLAFHPWDQPVERVLKSAEAAGLHVTTPMIGEQVIIPDVYPNKKWWRETLL